MQNKVLKNAELKVLLTVVVEKAQNQYHIILQF